MCIDLYLYFETVPYLCTMTLHIGIGFEAAVFTGISPMGAGVACLGPQQLLQWLEGRLGLGGYPPKTDHLRIELYRQSLLQHQSTAPEGAFYRNSFEADRFATAAVLLDWRDDLLLAGWDFQAGPDAPARLRTFAAVEVLYRQKLADPVLGALATGFADRFQAVMQSLAIVPLDDLSFVFYEPEQLLPIWLKRLITILQQKNIPILQDSGRGTGDGVSTPQYSTSNIQHSTFPPHASRPNSSALNWLKAHLRREVTGKKENGDDGSLLVLRVRRDSDAATYVAQIIARNTALKPVLLVQDRSRLLELALVQERQPALGLRSASPARPSLQALKLAQAFLWEPTDVFKIMEFVTLPVKPLDDGLSVEIARVLANKPGLFSDLWFAAVYSYLEDAAISDGAREQYEFWFNRRRYRGDSTAPKRDAIAIYGYLRQWAHDYFEQTGRKNSALLVLAEQARRVEELLEALPEARLSLLELERIVRTIYESAPVQLTNPEQNSLPWVQHPGALAAPPDTLLWWNCTHQIPPPTPDRWQGPERAWLENQGCVPANPATNSALQLWQQQQPVLQTKERLILVIPGYVDGVAVSPTLLLGDIEAAFTDCQAFTFDLDQAADCERLHKWLSIPPRTAVPPFSVGRPRPQLVLPKHTMLPSDYETPTGLELLFYYPHRWFFKNQLRLFPASLLSISEGNQLLGNLSHRFFEELLREDFALWHKKDVFRWVDDKANSLLEREGATLLLYGREPERQMFLNQVKNAGWSLISILRSNGWSVLYTEWPLEGDFGGIPIRGKADLVLQRGDERAVVDLKWSGAQQRKNMLLNGEDLQLALYAKLLPPEGEWAHTAYFIIRDGKMIARNHAAFKEALLAGKGEDHAPAYSELIHRMEKTFYWRREQLEKGILEVRTARTAPELEAMYGAILLELLEMKTEDSRWDDYRILIEFMQVRQAN
jgi:PD-(D/E)XK nuclease superfamily